LTGEELRRGGRRLTRKVRRYRPSVVAFLGIGAYRTAFARSSADLGLQQEKMAGASLWILPNPSGLNAHYQLADLAQLYAELRRGIE
jgi:TDG/mug DNA glycosylase family protein